MAKQMTTYQGDKVRIGELVLYGGFSDRGMLVGGTEQDALVAPIKTKDGVLIGFKEPVNVKNSFREYHGDWKPTQGEQAVISAKRRSIVKSKQVGKPNVQKYSEMYRAGYNNAAIRFGYIPDFASDQDRVNFEAGYKAGLAKRAGKLKSTGLPAGLSVKKAKNGWEVIHIASGNRLMPFAYPEKQLATNFAIRAGQVTDWTRPFKDLQAESEKLADLIRGGKKPGVFEKVLDMPTTFPSLTDDARKYHRQLGKLSGTFNARMKRLGANATDLQKETIVQQFRKAKDKLEKRYAHLGGVKLSEDEKKELRKISEAAADAGEKAVGKQRSRSETKSAKEPWEMTIKQYEKDMRDYWAGTRGTGPGSKSLPEDMSTRFKDYHKELVVQALNEGKPVPAAVLADYPDLKKQAETEAKAQFTKKWAKSYGDRPATVKASTAKSEKETLTKLQAIHDARSPRSKSADESRSNALTMDPDDPRVELWIRDPGRADVIGIDTPRKTRSRKSARKTKRASKIPIQVRELRR